MRRRISKALLATTAAGAAITTLGFAAAGVAGAMTTGPGSASMVHAPSAPSIATPPCSNAHGYVAFPVQPPGFGSNGGCAGYVASARDFRYTQATIRLPLINVNQRHFFRGGAPTVGAPTTTTPTTAATASAALGPRRPSGSRGPDATAPVLYTALSSSNAIAAAGFISCEAYLRAFGHRGLSRNSPCREERRVMSTSTPDLIGYHNDIWLAFGYMSNNTGSHRPLVRGFAIPGAQPGDGYKFQVYYNQQGNAVHFTIIAPDGSLVAAFSEDAHGAVFNHAAALVDWSLCPIRSMLVDGVAARSIINDRNYSYCADVNGDPVPGPVPFGHQKRITQFQGVAWTTASGDRGSVVGPWRLASVVATSNGILPPGGTIEVTPEFLWTSGLTGRTNDAFGVWWR